MLQFEAESEGVDPAGRTAISTQPTATRPGAAAPGAAAAVILVVIVDDASVGSYSCPGTGHSGDDYWNLSSASPEVAGKLTIKNNEVFFWTDVG